MTATIGLVLVWTSGFLAGQILFARPEMERTKDWEFLAGMWQEKYWEEFRKHNDDERFNISSIIPEYENQR